MKNQEVFKKYKHNPPHLLLDNTYYIVTGGTYQRLSHFREHEDKKLLLEIIKESCQIVRWQLKEWVILDNHYHLILRSYKGRDLQSLFGRIHRKSSNLLKRKNRFTAPRIWWNYWDTCIRGEKDFFKRINYVCYNPVKHGYVTDLANYVWSSFQDFQRRSGEEKVKKQLDKYSFEDLKIKDDF